MASYKTILEAAERIKPFVKETPVLTSSTLNELSGGRHLFFKCEIFQKVGAFKFRGASNAILKLTDDEAKQGVVTHSSGNHAQALALAARLRGIPAYIIMPKTAPVIKKKAVAGYGGRIYECEPNLAARSREPTTLPHLFFGNDTLKDFCRVMTSYVLFVAGSRLLRR